MVFSQTISKIQRFSSLQHVIRAECLKQTESQAQLCLMATVHNYHLRGKHSGVVPRGGDEEVDRIRSENCLSALERELPRETIHE